jgi:uncharacterized protein
MRSTSPISTSERRRRRAGAPLAAVAWLLAPLAAANGQAAAPDMVELRARAEAGDAAAQNELGGSLMATEDPALLAEAREWFRRAMEAGDVEARNNYAVMLVMGLGGPADEAEGRRLREEAAAAGSIAASMSLAERYLEGAEGYPLDPARALALFRVAADSATRAAPYAQWRVAMMHLTGVGVTADAAEAWRWVVRASDAGSVDAMISRAVMLATGEGTAEDAAAARLWYQRAAESGQDGFQHALRGLGAMLVAGEGGPADWPRGIAYLRIAEAAGDGNARILLDRWDDRITPEIARAATRISEQWLAEHLPVE